MQIKVILHCKWRDYLVQANPNLIIDGISVPELQNADNLAVIPKASESTQLKIAREAILKSTKPVIDQVKYTKTY